VVHINKGLENITSYVSGKPRDEVEKTYKVKKAVKMNSNENPMGVSPAAVRYAKKILNTANQYPESSNRLLREKIAERFSMKPENVFVGNGADEIIYYIAMSYLNDGDEVVIPEVTFPIYEIACRIMRAKIIRSAMRGFEIDLESMLEKINKKTRLAFLCNPNNPTGHALLDEQVYRFLEKVPSNVLLVMDEAYADFADPDTFPDTISRLKNGQNNMIVIKTLSKAYGLAGFRVGYGIASRDIIEIMNRIKLPFNISLISQYAAQGALQDHDFLNKTLDTTKNGRKLIYQGLKKLGLSFVESSTNFILVDTGRNGDKVTEELMKRGVIVRSAANYGYPTCFRVTVGTSAQNRKFLKAMEEIFR